jgi:hypothetical protein
MAAVDSSTLLVDFHQNDSTSLPSDSSLNGELERLRKANEGIKVNKNTIMT